jgi:zinc transport system permease protein
MTISMETVSTGIQWLLPFAWANYQFMQYALLAVLVVSPLFALMGTMVIGNRMTFFSDVLGHSALTGIAIGSLFGLADPQWAMIIFCALFAIAINIFKRVTQAPSDTVLGVFFAIVVGLGIMILSKGGGFTRYTVFLIGDILAVGPSQIGLATLLLIVVAGFWLIFGNALMLLSLNPALARSKGVPVFWLETLFAVFLALVVTISIRMVGILLINSLLILPAATARIMARSMRAYTLWAILISLVAGIAGLIASYYLGTSSGATIVMVLTACYGLSALLHAVKR